MPRMVLLHTVVKSGTILSRRMAVSLAKRVLFYTVVKSGTILSIRKAVSLSKRVLFYSVVKSDTILSRRMAVSLSKKVLFYTVVKSGTILSTRMAVSLSKKVLFYSVVKSGTILSTRMAVSFSKGFCSIRLLNQVPLWVYEWPLASHGGLCSMVLIFMYHFPISSQTAISFLIPRYKHYWRNELPQYNSSIQSHSGLTNPIAEPLNCTKVCRCYRPQSPLYYYRTTQSLSMKIFNYSARNFDLAKTEI